MVKDRMGSPDGDDGHRRDPGFLPPGCRSLQKVIKACADGGAKCIEFTNRGEFAAHVFLEVTRHFAKADPSVIMGVGSIVDAPTAGIYIANGARFVVGPVLNPDVAKLCNRRKIPYSPGCGSASRSDWPRSLGCEIVKIFPAGSVGGPDFVKAILAPSPWTRIMPTGAVDATEESLARLVRGRSRRRRHGRQSHQQAGARQTGLCGAGREGAQDHPARQDDSGKIVHGR